MAQARHNLGAHRIRLNRGDLGLGHEGIMASPEQTPGSPQFLFKLKLTRNVRRALAMVRDEAWQGPAAAGVWQVAEARVQLPTWSRKRRVVFARKLLIYLNALLRPGQPQSRPPRAAGLAAAGQPRGQAVPCPQTAGPSRPPAPANKTIATSPICPRARPTPGRSRRCIGSAPTRKTSSTNPKTSGLQRRLRAPARGQPPRRAPARARLQPLEPVRPALGTEPAPGSRRGAPLVPPDRRPTGQTRPSTRRRPQRPRRLVAATPRKRHPRRPVARCNCAAVGLPAGSPTSNPALKINSNCGI